MRYNKWWENVGLILIGIVAICVVTMFCVMTYQIVIHANDVLFWDKN